MISWVVLLSHTVLYIMLYTYFMQYEMRLRTRLEFSPTGSHPRSHSHFIRPAHVQHRTTTAPETASADFVIETPSILKSNQDLGIVCC